VVKLPVPVTVAAAANVRPLLDPLQQAIQEATGTSLTLIYGASGSFFAQIGNGAPFDLFLSADNDYPRRLDEAGLTVPGSRSIYAIGRLALWASASSPLPVESEGLAALRHPRSGHIAIANPDVAPYGSAAITAMQRAGVYDAVQNRIVLGENVAQAAQFAQSGAAGAAIIPLSLAMGPELRGGHRYEIPVGFHPPVEQAGVVLRGARDPEAAVRVLAFLRSPAGAAALQAAGYLVPEVAR
jgi:molybdate transport system substrate-binding protein